LGFSVFGSGPEQASFQPPAGGRKVSETEYADTRISEQYWIPSVKREGVPTTVPTFCPATREVD
jgi:hypothetical protein